MLKINLSNLKQFQISNKTRNDDSMALKPLEYGFSIIKVQFPIVVDAPASSNQVFMHKIKIRYNAFINNVTTSMLKSMLIFMHIIWTLV